MSWEKIPIVGEWEKVPSNVKSMETLFREALKRAEQLARQGAKYVEETVQRWGKNRLMILVRSKREFEVVLIFPISQEPYFSPNWEFGWGEVAIFPTKVKGESVLWCTVRAYPSIKEKKVWETLSSLQLQ